ncbi:UNVERIFIED_CONTAM: hypothetical protein GTU68_020996 [Idotea baltica]|nr:hypothetical protein [Idotea baltica]
MRYARLLIDQQIIPACSNDGGQSWWKIKDIPDITPDNIHNLINNNFESSLIKGELQFLSPILKPGNILCAGLNYKSHIEELGMSIPERPEIFMKHSGSANDPYGDIILPKDSKKVDWEVELGVIISKKAHNISPNKALDYILGFVVVNDISEREWQLEAKQWIPGKGFPTSCPFGPVIVTPDELSNYNNLRLYLKVNNQIKQDSNTLDLVFNIEELISTFSKYFELLPGDLISTGTPGGVAMSKLNDFKFLKSADIIEAGIEGIGILENRVI